MIVNMGLRRLAAAFLRRKQASALQSQLDRLKVQPFVLPKVGLIGDRLRLIMDCGNLPLPFKE
jgi:hypothetical protein